MPLLPAPGISHHLLFPESMTDPAIHEATLREIVAWPEFTLLDLFCAGDAAQRTREIALVTAAGKRVVYNTPLLGQMPGCDPNTLDSTTMARTREAALPHLDAACACGARKINIASGPNPAPEMRAAARDGWVAFLAWFGREAGARGMQVVIEPFDQSIGKNLLIGPTADAVDSVETVHADGVANIGLMVDMGHLPIMGESFHDAIQRSASYLWHVHLGNAVIRDPAHPWYGDCHPPLGIPEGEHDATHLAAFLHELKSISYFDDPDATVTLEMRPYPGLSPRDSANRGCRMVQNVLLED